MAIVMIAFYVLNFLSPEYHEDFLYKFMIEGGLPNHSHPISSIRDIITSQMDHYSTYNGRSIIHFLAQLFTGLLGKQVFNIVNVLVFAVFIWLMKRNVTRQTGIGINGFALAVTLVLTLMMPRFKDVFLWMTGSINYLWSATAVLLFLFLYEKKHQLTAGRSLFWLLPLSFLLGWTHEGISLPIAISMVFFNLLEIKKSHHRTGLWMTVFLLGGACIVALAPGTISRSGASHGITASSVGLRIITGFLIISKLKVVYLALLLTVIAWFHNRNKTRNIISQNNYLILAALLSCAIVLLCGIRSPRSAFGLELFAMIYVLRLLGAFVEQMRPHFIQLCTYVMTIGLVVFYILLLRHAIPTWQESQRLISQITQTSDGIIGTHEHQSGIFSDHICTMLTLDSTASAVNFNPAGWARSIAATYHCDSLVFLPQTFLDDLKKNSGKYEHFDLKTSYEFFVEKIDTNDVISEIHFLLSPPDFSVLPFIFRPIAKKMNSYNQTTAFTNKWATVTLYGKRYLLIKREHDYDERLVDIQITYKNKDQEQIKDRKI